MARPKSVVKVSKNGVTYTSNVEFGQYAIHELSRAALADVAKFIKKRWRDAYYSGINRRSGNAPKSFYFKVWSTASTKFPRVDVGIAHATRSKPVKGFYAFFQEYQHYKREGRKLLKQIVDNNKAQIVEIESQYLTALEDEAKALRLIESIGEGEEVVGGENDE